MSLQSWDWLRIFRQQEQIKRTIVQLQLRQWRQERTRKLIDVSTRFKSSDLSRQRIRQPEFFAIQRTEEATLHLHGINRACFAGERRAYGLCDLPMDLVRIISKTLLLIDFYFYFIFIYLLFFTKICWNYWPVQWNII